jgi:hypothetical protein
VVRKELSGRFGLFRSDHIHFSKNATGAQGEIVRMSDGHRYEVQHPRSRPIAGSARSDGHFIDSVRAASI